MTLIGGFSEFKTSFDDIKYLEPYVRNAIELEFEKLGNYQLETFKILGYRQQVVAGIKYLFTAETNNGNYDVEIWEQLPCHGGGINIVGVHRKTEYKSTCKMFGGYGPYKPGLGDKNYLERYVEKAIYNKLASSSMPIPTYYKIIRSREKIVAGTFYQIEVETDVGQFNVYLFERLPSDGGTIIIDRVERIDGPNDKK